MGRVKNEQGARRNYHQNKKYDYASSHQQQNTVQIGQHGFFVTFCSTKESFVRNEIYNLFNRFADQLFGPEFVEEASNEPVELNDLDSALESEKLKLNQTKKQARRFQIVKSGTNHSFFVRTSVPLLSINALIESIFNTSIQSKEQHSRYVERLLPIAFICKAYEDDLRKLIIKPEFIAQILSVADETKTILFDVQAKKSNNTQMKSSHLEEIVITDLASRKVEDLDGNILKRDYKKPHVQILIHVIKNLILISIVRNYETYKKYNLASINAATVIPAEQQKKTTFEDNDEEEEEKEDEEETKAD
jgi:tRNA acetyltransferase TAN1